MVAAWLVRTAIVDESRNGVPDILTYLWLNMAPAAVSSATFALVIVDTVNGIMVLSTWLEDELKKRRQQQIRAAVDSERQRWLGWNRRREAAVAAGEDFDEPPPVLYRTRKTNSRELQAQTSDIRRTAWPYRR